jgi:hypothetical protein
VTASAIWVSESTLPCVVESPSNPIEIDRMDAAGATPITPEFAPVPLPAASEATMVPCSDPSEPTGLCPFDEP